MTNPFETVVLNMQKSGMFQFMLPFMLTSAIFYGLLRKSRLFGEAESNVVINAVVSLVAAFMVWSAPILLGVDIEMHMARFFVQGISVTLVVMVGLMVVGMIAPPNLPEHFKTVFKDKPGLWTAILVGGILVGAIIGISSGFINVYFPSAEGEGGFEISEEMVSTIGVILMMALPLLLIIMLSR